MPGTTGKIPKNANNKNESSRARSPSPVCVPHWWWLGRDGVGRRHRCRCRRRRRPTNAGSGRRRHRRRHRRLVAGGDGGSDGGGGRGSGDGETKNGWPGAGGGGWGWKKCKSPDARGASSGDNTRRWMPIIFICNRRSIKQITQKCSEGKIELFFDAPQRREDPALKKKKKKEGEPARGEKRKGRSAARGMARIPSRLSERGRLKIRVLERRYSRASLPCPSSPSGFSLRSSPIFYATFFFSRWKG